MAKKLIYLFDVDGTLTKSRQKITESMANFIRETAKKVPLAIVGGSDLCKIVEQLGNSQEEVLNTFEFVFSENGLVGFHKGKEFKNPNLVEFLGEEKLQKFINFSLRYIADLTIPVKRGTFIEFRRGMINISPIGRNCSQSERDQFNAYDQLHKIRSKFVEDLNRNFPLDQYGLQFSIGGQISIDAFPVGWDKTFCLKFITDSGYDTIHFFGDKTEKGGNDHEVFEDPRTIGHTVTSPEDTMAQLEALLHQSDTS